MTDKQFDSACKEVLAFLTFNHLKKILGNYYRPDALASEAHVAGKCYGEITQAYDKVYKRTKSERRALLTAYVRLFKTLSEAC